MYVSVLHLINAALRPVSKVILKAIFVLITMKFPLYPINNEVWISDKSTSSWMKIVDTKSLDPTKILKVIVSIYFDEYVNNADGLITIIF